MLHSYPPSASASLASDCRWIDLVAPDEDEIELVRGRFGITVPTKEELTRIDASSGLRADGDTLRMSAPLLSGKLIVDGCDRTKGRSPLSRLPRRADQ